MRITLNKLLLFMAAAFSSNLIFSHSSIAAGHECSIADPPLRFSEMRDSYLYLMPSAVGGDLFWDLDNFWLEIGYARKIADSSNHLFDIKIGVIVHSMPTGQTILTEIHAQYSKGFNMNLEHKIYFKKDQFYYSTNFLYQYSMTARQGEYDAATYRLQNPNNTYFVHRNVFAVLPKIGAHLVWQNYLYFDLGLCAGVRLITSTNRNKINSFLNSGEERFSGKQFDQGTKITHRINLQLKLGFNF